VIAGKGKRFFVPYRRRDKGGAHGKKKKGGGVWGATGKNPRSLPREIMKKRRCRPLHRCDKGKRDVGGEGKEPFLEDSRPTAAQGGRTLPRAGEENPEKGGSLRLNRGGKNNDHLIGKKGHKLRLSKAGGG